LSDIWPALRRDGILIYSTCSYSREEDEDILDWVVDELDATGCRLELNPEWNIVESGGNRKTWGYRFYPDRLNGEGFFIACLRKNGGGSYSVPRRTARTDARSEEHTSELQSLAYLVCRLLLE